VKDPCITGGKPAQETQIKPKKETNISSLVNSFRDLGVIDNNQKNQKKCNLTSNSNGAENLEEHKMSLTELISTYYEEIKEFSTKNNPSQNDIIQDSTEEMDISLFNEDLKENVSLTNQTKENLEEFNCHIFYSELYDIMGDIQRTNDQYLLSVNERDPETSKFHLACYLEHVFKFLNELNQSLISRDTENITYLLSIVDEVYYNGYMEYYYRGYEEASFEEQQFVNSFD
jgi:hypothetical protein